MRKKAGIEYERDQARGARCFAPPDSFRAIGWPGATRRFSALAARMASDPLIYFLTAFCVANGLALVAMYWRWSEQRQAFAALAKIVERASRGELDVAVPRQSGEAAGLAKGIGALIALLRKEKLTEHPDRLFEQAMLRETPNGLLVVDGAGKIRSLNPSARALLPWPGEPVGQLAAAVVQVSELYDVIEETGQTRKIAERSVRVGNKELLMRGVPLADGSGTLGVILDITSVRNAERARRDFVANVSHEIRTPITSILGFSEALAGESLPLHTEPMIEAITRNARRLAALTDDVLMLSKIEARGSDLPADKVLLATVITEVIERLSGVAASRQVQVSVNCPADLYVWANAEALDHALGNLVENALKYSPAGSVVVVSGAAAEHGVELAVVDNGIGIDDAHQPRIFERFYRVDKGRSRDTGGTGLGLALVKHLALAMGAEISFTSAIGKGSRFVLKLPATEG